jgi:hypothetical protein
MPQALNMPPPRRFDFERDAFAFANELVCEYVFDPAGGRPKMVAKQPGPEFALRCFPLVRAARQFFFHAEFRPQETPVGEAGFRQRIREVFSRSPRLACAAGRRVVFPGYGGLREFSRAWERLLKEECGGAWRSYVLRSHWRMVFPISRGHQRRSCTTLQERLAQGVPPIVHLVRFPQLTINHGMLLCGVEEGAGETRFHAYDPNDPTAPAVLSYQAATRGFTLPANRYWPGGRLDVIEIYRSWWF